MSINQIDKNKKLIYRFVSFLKLGNLNILPNFAFNFDLEKIIHKNIKLKSL